MFFPFSRIPQEEGDGLIRGVARCQLFQGNKACPDLSLGVRPDGFQAVEGAAALKAVDAAFDFLEHLLRLFVNDFECCHDDCILTQK